MKIGVCIGSSCHIKNSHEIVSLFQEYLEKNQLTDKVNLCGTFCLGKCSGDGVSVQIDDGEVYRITPDNFEEFATKHLKNL